MKSIVALLGAVPVFVWATVAFASAGITYHGRLMKSNGTPVTAANVQFQIQIRTPGAENCLMYQETQVKNLSGTSGVFSLTINDGTATVPNSEPFTLSEVFRNHGTFNFAAGKCSGGTSYSPNPTDGRMLVVEFNDGSGWQVLPSQQINYVPMAIESETVGGRTPYSFLRVEDAVANTTDNNKELTLSDLTELWALIGGTSSQYMKSSSSGASLPSFTASPSGHQEGNIWYDTTDHKLRFDDGSGVQTVGTSGGSVTGITVGDGLVDGSDNTGTTITTSGTIKLPDVGTADTYYKVTTDAKGRVMNGSTSLTESDLPNITTAGKVSGSAITSGTIGGSTAINTSGDLSVHSITASGNITNNGDGSTTGVIYGASLQTRRLYLYDDGTNRVTVKTPSTLDNNYTLTLPSDKGAAGDVLSTDASGNLSWISPATGSVTSISGTPPLTVDNSTPAAPAVSIAQASSTADGYLSKTDWTTFNNKLSAIGNTASLSDGKIWVGDSSGKAQEKSISGDVGLTDAGVASVNKIKGYGLDFTTAPASGNFLKYNGTDWTAAAITESDVSGLATDLSDKISAGQMPANCTSGQTLTFSSPTGTWTCSDITVAGSNFASQTANTVLAAPDGSNGTPTFRTLTANDIPSGVATQWTNGTGGAIYYNGGNVGIGTTVPQALLDLGAVKANSKIILYDDGTYKYGLGVQNAQFRLHLSQNVDRFSFFDAPNGNEVFTIKGNGNVGIGTTDPGAKLDVKGTFRLSGSSSGYVGFQPAAAAGSTTYTLPTSDGTSGQVLSTDGSGVLSWTSPAMTSGVSVTAPITNSGTGAAPNIGISQATTSTNGYLSSTDWNTFNDKLSPSLANGKIWVGGSGGVATAVTPSGDATISNAGVITVTSATGFSGSLSGDVTGSQGATVVSSVGGSSAANVHAAEVLANAATSANTASTIVKRDPSGNFSAGKITANLNGNVSGDVTGNVTGNVSGTAANVTGTVAVANGGTGLGTTPTNGQILIGNGTGYTLATITAGTGVTITNNAGSIEISAAASFRTSCPSGFTLIGTSGTAEAFCISSNQEASATWLNAIKKCYNKSPKARLCSVSEWVMACAAGASGPNNMIGHGGDWVTNLSNYSGGNGGSFAELMGTYGSCDTIYTQPLNTSSASRCCFH